MAGEKHLGPQVSIPHSYVHTDTDAPMHGGITCLLYCRKPKGKLSTFLFRDLTLTLKIKRVQKGLVHWAPLKPQRRAGLLWEPLGWQRPNSPGLSPS